MNPAPPASPARADGTLTIGVDIGTASSKGVLVDATSGEVIATAVRLHRVDTPHPGWFEMNGEIWWKEFIEITQELLAARDKQRPASPVSSVGVSGMGPCVLLTEADDTPVRPAILYGVDTRASNQVRRMTEELGTDRIAKVGGSHLSSQAAGPKIVWVRENEPDAWSRAERLYMPATYLVRHLTGRYVLDHQSASQCTPLYDIEAAQWDATLWSAYAAPLIMPDLAWAQEIIGHITAEAAAATGLTEGTPVTAGTIDAWSEAISVDAHSPGDLMVMYGSTMFLIATQTEVVRHPSMWTTAGAFTGTRNLAGGLATSGALTQWISDLTGQSFTELLAAASEVGPGANGLLMLPYFAGERTPIQDPDARGVLVGLTLAHQSGDLYRAALEATAFAVRHNIETMRAAGARIDRMVAVGGGTQGRLWLQIVSDITGLPQDVPQTTVGAAYGSAFLAAAAAQEGIAREGVAGGGTAREGMAGGEPNGPARRPGIAAWNPVADVIAPDPDVRSFYDDRYRLYRQLYLDTRDIAHTLATEHHRHDQTDETTAGDSA